MKQLIVVLLLSICDYSSSQNLIDVPFDSVHWAYDNLKDVEYKEHLGVKGIFLKSGFGYLKNVDVSNGSIEVDVAPPAPRTFEGVIFRYDGKENAEQVYIRYHKSIQPDAVQYDPIFKREATWQLYPDYQATKKWTENKWIHMKVEFYKDRAKVYFDNETTPTLLIDDLKTDLSSGKIGINGQFGAYFANFKYSPTIDGEAFDKSFVGSPKIYPNFIRNYEISQGFYLASGQTPSLTDIPKSTWEKISLGPEGVLDIPKYRDKKKSGNFEDNSNDYIWIRLKISSDKGILKTLKFDFTNKVYIYCNGTPLYEGNNTFRSKGLLFRGEIDKQADAHKVYLPLKMGYNEILIAVSSVANGWGWIAKWE